jgi:hypothetical protein
VKKAIRTVTPSSTGHRDAGMNAIGWVIFLGILVVLLSLIPIVIVG